MNPPLLRFALLAGAAYFCAMAIAHYFGVKLPMLFVYYDTPFYAYQDKIISLTMISAIALFYSAAQNRVVVPIALTTLGLSVLGLASINLSDDLTQLLQEGQTTRPYWNQTGAFAGYWALLLTLYLGGEKSE